MSLPKGHRPNDKLPPLQHGHWRGVPMNAVRLRTIVLNQTRVRPS